MDLSIKEIIGVSNGLAILASRQLPFVFAFGVARRKLALAKDLTAFQEQERALVQRFEAVAHETKGLQFKTDGDSKAFVAEREKLFQVVVPVDIVPIELPELQVALEEADVIERKLKPAEKKSWIEPSVLEMLMPILTGEPKAA